MTSYRTKTAPRIAFMGASGTGKTTLARWVSDAYGLPMNPVGSRSTAKAMGFDNPYDVDAAGERQDFQDKLLADKAQWELDHRAEGFVTDRSTLDNLTYTTLHGGLLGPSNEAESGEAYIAKALAHHRTYNVVIPLLVESGQWVDGDPARVSNQAYHRLYQRLLDTHKWGPFVCRTVTQPRILAARKKALAEVLKFRFGMEPSFW